MEQLQEVSITTGIFPVGHDGFTNIGHARGHSHLNVGQQAPGLEFLMTWGGEQIPVSWVIVDDFWKYLPTPTLPYLV